MYKKLLYSKLNYKQKKHITDFIKLSFESLDNVALEENTIIILMIEENTFIENVQDYNKVNNIDNIIGCICLLNNIHLQEKIIKSNLPSKFYNFDPLLNGIFLYNFCVHPNYRNKNYGNGFILEAIKLSKKLNLKYIHCNAENNISKNLFIKNEFIEVEQFNNSNKIIYLLSKYL